MKKLFAAFFLSALLSTSVVFADQKPINLKAVKAVRPDKCLVKVAVFIGGKPYAFSRLQGIKYTKVDGTRVTVSDPKHPWNDCDLTNLGDVTSFSTGLMKSGIDLRIDYFPNEDAKKKFITTYADRREPILEKMAKDEFKMMEDYTDFLKWTSSIMYVLPGSATTDNEEPVAIYCKVPAGVKDDPSVPSEKRRKLCSTSYLLPGGLGFTYTYLEGLKIYKPTQLDRDIRDYFASTPLKEIKQEAPAQ